MRAGLLEQRIALSRNEPTKNAFNEDVDSWTSYASTWARVSPISGSERWAAQQINAEITHEVEIRWSPAVKDIKAEHRVEFDGRVFKILGPYVPHERRVNIIIPCAEEIR
jgi:SPP1 family predicted phage head-tail adaptor